MQDVGAVQRVIASGEKLLDAELIFANHLKNPIAIHWKFSTITIEISVDEDEDTFNILGITKSDAKSVNPSDSEMRRLVGTRLKVFRIIKNAQGYYDRINAVFSNAAQQEISLDLTSGASQIEVMIA